MPPLAKAAMLGVVQGLTEFLPISSTAHILLVRRLLGFDDPHGIFTVLIQPGAILAVMWLYRQKIWTVITGLPSDPASRRFAIMIVVATLPSIAAGALFSGFVKDVLYDSLAVIAVAFIVGGIVMLVVERIRPAPDVMDVDSLPLGRAVGIGSFQALALIPGVSRSGGTIVAAMVMRVERAAAAEFTFFLAMPFMLAAFTHDLWEVRHDLDATLALEIAVGFVMAFLSAAVIVRPFLNYVRRRGFAPFAWYRILFGVLLLVAVTARWV